MIPTKTILDQIAEHEREIVKLKNILLERGTKDANVKRIGKRQADALAKYNRNPEFPALPLNEELLMNWLEYRHEIRKPLSEKGIRLLVKKWSLFPNDVISATINKSIENGWQGLFYEKSVTNERSTTAGLSETTAEQFRRMANS